MRKTFTAHGFEVRQSYDDTWVVGGSANSSICATGKTPEEAILNAASKMTAFASAALFAFRETAPN